LDYVPGPVGAPKIGKIKKGGEKVMTSKLPWATAAIILVVVATVGAWILVKPVEEVPIKAPAWSPIVGYVPGQGGIIAIYCVKTTTNLATNPTDWTTDNYYAKITAAGTLTVPSLTNFYVVVEAKGQRPYVAGLNRDNIIVEGFKTTLRENKTGTAFSWYTVEGTENIKVSAAFDNNGGAIDQPFYLLGEEAFDYTAKVWQFY
jgi:hypothetical protein